MPNEIALCVTGQMMGATTRFKIIEALGKQAGPSHTDLKPVRTLKDRHYKVIEDRNRVVHDPWFVVRDTDDGSRVGEVSQLKVTGQTPIDESAVLETVGKIRELIDEAGQMRNSLADALRTLRGK